MSCGQEAGHPECGECGAAALNVFALASPVYASSALGDVYLSCCKLEQIGSPITVTSGCHTFCRRSRTGETYLTFDTELVLRSCAY